MKTITIRLKDSVETVLDKTGISMKSGEPEVWTEDKFDKYFYNEKFFIIEKNGSWVALYNLDEIVSIIIKGE